MMRPTLAAALLLAGVLPAAAPAQEAAPAREPTRWRIILGPQIRPNYPGADGYAVRPYVDVSRTKGDAPFAFEAPDESTGMTLVGAGGRFQAGPAIGFVGKRRQRDAGGLSSVGFTVELGGFVQYELTPAFRVRGELRQGVGGHGALTGVVGADYIARDGDERLFSIGPRVTLASDRYARKYFGVGAADAARTGVPAYDAGGGVQAVGVTAGYLHQLGEHWGVFGYARYDRLVGDAADSPVVRRFGSRNQPSVGVAASYRFTRR